MTISDSPPAQVSQIPFPEFCALLLLLKGNLPPGPEPSLTWPIPPRAFLVPCFRFHEGMVGPKPLMLLLATAFLQRTKLHCLVLTLVVALEKEKGTLDPDKEEALLAAGSEKVSDPQVSWGCQSDSQGKPHQLSDFDTIVSNSEQARVSRPGALVYTVSSSLSILSNPTLTSSQDRIFSILWISRRRLSYYPPSSIPQPLFPLLAFLIHNCCLCAVFLPHHRVGSMMIGCNVKLLL